VTYKQWLLVASAIVVSAPQSAVAQTPPNQPRPRTLVPTGGPHGRIGVVVKTGAAPTTDSIGAWIEAVTPGGPASKAGLRAGDVITKFNGTALAGLPAPEENASGPGRKLVSLARGLSPGDTAPIEYRRGSDVKKTKIVTEDVGSWMVIVDPVDHIGPGMIPPPGIGDPGYPSFCFGDSWCDIELVSVTPELGDYFGTKEGVLVVKAPGDSSLPLKSGDVILAIGGRRPTSPSHAMRILRSYEAGESVTIEILRKQKHISIAWQVPRSEDRVRPFLRMHRIVPDSEPPKN
jgi:S1-C subfamily serine protease